MLALQGARTPTHPQVTVRVLPPSSICAGCANALGLRPRGRSVSPEAVRSIGAGGVRVLVSDASVARAPRAPVPDRALGARSARRTFRLPFPSIFRLVARVLIQPSGIPVHSRFGGIRTPQTIHPLLSRLWERVPCAPQRISRAAHPPLHLRVRKALRLDSVKSAASTASIAFYCVFTAFTAFTAFYCVYTASTAFLCVHCVLLRLLRHCVPRQASRLYPARYIDTANCARWA